MLSVYKDEIRDAMYPRRGTVDKRFNIVNVMPPEHWDAERIKKLRNQLQLSQSLFAETMGVSVPAVVAWENGRTNPSSLACRLFDILSRYPDILLEARVVEIRK